MSENRNTSLVVQERFPEFFREEYSTFVEFVKAYYDYLDTTYSGNLDSIKDIDTCDEVFLDNFRSQYTSQFPELSYFQLRTFVKNAKEFYSAKGNSRSIEFLFKVLFNDEIQINYPYEFLLKASSGTWAQEYFLAVNTVYGTIPSIPFVLTFQNETGNYSLEISKTEIVSPTETRLYFVPDSPFKIVTGQLMFIKSASGDNLFVGEHVKSPAKVKIQFGGRYWPNGKLIKITGTSKDTIAKVSRIDKNGKILAVEILEYGYVHSENQILTISPFKNRPSSSVTEYVKTLVAISPSFIYHHDLVVNDYTSGTSESIIGNLNGSAAIRGQYINNTGEESSYTDITISQWIDSRATLSLEYADVVKARGNYTSETGIIQNNSIRLQDNNFYQTFSYEIETHNDYREYNTALQVVHPAGFRWYGSLSKNFNYTNSYSSFRTLSNDTLYFFDTVGNFTDTIVKEFTKTESDSIPSPTDIITSRSLNKLIADASISFIDNGLPNYGTSYYIAEDYVDLSYFNPDLILSS